MRLERTSSASRRRQHGGDGRQRPVGKLSHLVDGVSAALGAATRHGVQPRQRYVQDRQSAVQRGTISYIPLPSVSALRFFNTL